MNNILKKPLRYSFYNVSLALIIINILVFFLNMLVSRSYVYLAMTPSVVINYHFYWQFVSYMFVHSGIRHIAFNMLALFFFGQAVERRIGSSEFLLFYLLTGTLAGIFSFIVYVFAGTNVTLLGASGAVYAVLFAYAAFYPDSRIYIFGLVPIKASTLVILYTAIELFSQFANVRSGVAHLTHLAGFGFAYLYCLIRFGINPIDSLRGGGRRWR